MITRIKTLAREKRQELDRFLKFCVVGTIGTIIDFGLLNLCYNVLGWPQVLSNIISTSAATVNNYTWSRFWVYPETKHQQGGKKFVQFVIVSIIAIGLNTLILNSHMECKYKLLVETFQNWLEKVVTVCHSTKKHEPEYCVVLHQLERYKKQFLGGQE